MQAALHGLTDDFSVSLDVTRISEELIFSLAASTDAKIDSAETVIETTTLEGQQSRLEAIKANRDAAAGILTGLSLCFEAAQNNATYVAEGTLLQPESKTGTVPDFQA